MSIENLEVRLATLGVCSSVVDVIKNGFDSGKLQPLTQNWNESLGSLESLIGGLTDTAWTQFQSNIAKSTYDQIQGIFSIKHYNDPRQWVEIAGDLKFAVPVRLVAAIHAYVLNFGHVEFGMVIAARMAEILVVTRVNPAATAHFLEQIVHFDFESYEAGEAQLAIKSLATQFAPELVSEFLKAFVEI